MTDTLPPRIEVSLFTKDGTPWCRCNDAPAEVGCCCDHMEKERPAPPTEALELARLIKQARSGGGNGYPYDVCRKLADACEALLASRPQESVGAMVPESEMIKWRALAQEMTPGGSEFMSVDAVRGYYQEFKRRYHEAKCNEARLSKEIAARLSAEGGER